MKSTWVILLAAALFPLQSAARAAEVEKATTSSLQSPASGYQPSDSSDADALPTIDEMGTMWLEVDQLAHMPSLHNFHDMAVCATDLLGVNYFPGRTLNAGAGPRWPKYFSLPGAWMLLDGEGLRAIQCRWLPFEVQRRCQARELEVETSTRLVFEGRGLMFRIQVRNTTSKDRTADLAVVIPYDWTTATQSMEPPLIGYHDALSGLTIAYAFVDAPSDFEPWENTLQARWKLTVPAGGKTAIRFLMTTAPEPGRACAEAQRLRRAFVEIWEQARRRWAERWRQAFTPGNAHFSGSLPLLKTTNSRLREIYYRSVLTLLTLERTNLPGNDRIFITSGERPPGLVYFWDTGLWPTVFALLEPRALEAQLDRLLQCDPRGGGTFNFITGRQGEGWHAANAWSLFKLGWAWAGVTNQTGWLDRPLGGRTVIERLNGLAQCWTTLTPQPGGALADYGEPWNLLDCVPAYAHGVASFNAANAWMMRRLADLRERRGEADEAARLRAEAGRVARAVLDLYVPGQGVWACRQPGGERVEVRHCCDFVLVGACLAGDLPEKTKQEMLGFVTRELLLNNWMRAMSLSDPAAERSDLPDHGPLGAFVAWPALTVGAMCELGDPRRALMFLNQTQAALVEGVYGQAHELYGSKRLDPVAAVRIAQRGGMLRECSAGGAFAELVIGTLFGFRPEPGVATVTLHDPQVPRTFEGKLFHVRRGEDYYTITAGPRGLKLDQEPRR